VDRPVVAILAILARRGVDRPLSGPTRRATDGWRLLVERRVNLYPGLTKQDQHSRAGRYSPDVAASAAMMILSLPMYLLRLSLLSMVMLWLGLLWLMAHDSIEKDPFGVIADHASY
jgi:hypothetical protein